MSIPAGDPNETGVGEAELIAALRRRDPAAFEVLVRTFGGRLLAVAERLLRGKEDASDAVQDAFISAFRTIDRFEGKSSLGTWLHRIVVNASLMRLRSRARRPEISIDELLPRFNRFGHHADRVRRWHQPPDAEILSEENRALVRACIDRLPEDYRIVLLLRDIEELSTEETAAALEISVAAAKVRLHRARQALRTLLEPHFGK